MRTLAQSVSNHRPWVALSTDRKRRKVTSLTSENFWPIDQWTYPPCSPRHALNEASQSSKYAVWTFPPAIPSPPLCEAVVRRTASSWTSKKVSPFQFVHSMRQSSTRTPSCSMNSTAARGRAGFACRKTSPRRTTPSTPWQWTRWGRTATSTSAPLSDPAAGWTNRRSATSSTKKEPGAAATSGSVSFCSRFRPSTTTISRRSTIGSIVIRPSHGFGAKPQSKGHRCTANPVPESTLQPVSHTSAPENHRSPRHDRLEHDRRPRARSASHDLLAVDGGVQPNACPHPRGSILERAVVAGCQGREWVHRVARVAVVRQRVLRIDMDLCQCGVGVLAACSGRGVRSHDRLPSPCRGERDHEGSDKERGALPEHGAGPGQGCGGRGRQRAYTLTWGAAAKHPPPAESTASVAAGTAT